MTPGTPYAEVIGDPVAHSKSPLIHRFWLQKLGLEGEYRATQVRKEDLPSYLTVRRHDPLWRGCNVTMPLKEVALPLAERRMHDAELVRATNALVKERDGTLTACNTDVDGFREAFRRGCEQQRPCANQVDLEIALIGTGGAARAALAELRGADVTIYGRDVAKARALSEEFGPGGDGYHDHLDVLMQPPFVYDPAFPDCTPNRGEAQRHDYVIVNATSLGMTGQPPLPIRLDSFPENSVVIDMVYDPLETQLLKEARSLGMVTVDGLVMLIGQAARAFELFFGAKPPREHDEELRRTLLS